MPLEKSFSVDVHKFNEIRRDERRSLNDRRKVSLDIEGLENFELKKPEPPAATEVGHSSLEIRYN